jgi:hypothetical protein
LSGNGEINFGSGESKCEVTGQAAGGEGRERVGERIE